MFDRRTRRKLRNAEPKKLRHQSERLTRDFLHAESLARTSTDLTEKVRMQRLMARINTRAIGVAVQIWGVRQQAQSLLNKAS